MNTAINHLLSFHRSSLGVTGRHPAPWAVVVALALSAPLSGCQKNSGASTIEIDTVFIFTIDAVNTGFLMGTEEAWDTAPNIQEFLQDSVWLANTITSRGMTTPALTSMLTGTYPRDHGVRNNLDGDITDLPTIAGIFQENDWTTMGWMSNGGWLLDESWDEAHTSERPGEGEDPDQVADDVAWATDIVEQIGQLDPEEKVLGWFHSYLPHSPYEAVEPWYSRFHPDPYEGDLDLTDDGDLNMVIMGERELSEEDLKHVQAVYASGIRETDERFAEVVRALKYGGRWENTLFVFGVDHGEEMYEHADYFFHGCSAYNSVLNVTYGMHGGGLPSGVVIDEPVSITDITPTIVDMVGNLKHDADFKGQSLASYMFTGATITSPTFFERGTASAGVISNGYKLILTPELGFDSCAPYSQAGSIYPAGLEELYDLQNDPDEQNNLAVEATATLDELRSLTCEWVQQDAFDYEHKMDTNKLVAYCEEYGFPTP